MTIRGSRRGNVAHLAAVFTAALLVTGAPAAWAWPETPAPPAATLVVESQPSGATVYVDGRARGTTPVAIEAVPVGEHAVRLVKDGFLENRRVIPVASAGVALQVTLTPTGPQLTSTPPDAAGEGKPSEGKSRRRLIVIGGLGLAGLTAGCLLTVCKGNDAPQVSSVAVDPQVALQGATEVSFSVVARDPEGKALTSTWDFGDGASATGASVTHTYETTGAFEVTVEVRDDEDAATTGRASVVVKGMTGRWTGRLDGNNPITFNLEQSGSVVAGNYQAVYPGKRTVAGSVAGRVVAPDRVTMTVRVPRYFPLILEAPLDSARDAMRGTVTENGVPYTFDLVRQ